MAGVVSPVAQTDCRLETGDWRLAQVLNTSRGWGSFSQRLAVREDCGLRIAEQKSSLPSPALASCLPVLFARPEIKSHHENYTTLTQGNQHAPLTVPTQLPSRSPLAG